MNEDIIISINYLAHNSANDHTMSVDIVKMGNNENISIQKSKFELIT